VGYTPHTVASLVCSWVDDLFLTGQPGVVDSGRSLGGHLHGDALCMVCVLFVVR